jgi:hypothetical protein
MSWQRLFSLFFPAIISSAFMFIGCSKPILKMPKPLPPIVKQYKHKIVHGNVPGMQNTGIYLKKGDIYSILATGSIDTWPTGPRGHDVGPGDGRFIARIGKNIIFHPMVWPIVGTQTADDSGRLYLGITDGKVNRYGEPYRPEWYKDNIGSFSVDIIVWERENYSQIADLFEKMKERDPENKAIADAFFQANRQKEIYLAQVKASKEIEETKKEIQKLRQESQREKEVTTKSIEEKEPLVQPQPTTGDLSKDEKIVHLEAKLSGLMENLKQLEEMKKQFEEEKKKTSLLTKELEEKEEREKDLLSRLRDGNSIPPVLVVAAPRDGIEVEIGTITFSGVAEDDQGLKGLEIFVNDNPLVAKTNRDIKISGGKHPRRLEFAERILLQKGKNEIRIQAIDTDALTAEKVLTVHYREVRKNVWAVVIGIDRYQNTRHLKYAGNDARAFYNHLIRNNHIPEENVTLLLNEEAHINRLRSILGTHLKNKAGKDDMVIIFFAGHGACEKDVTSPDKDGLEKYILPYDADPKDLYASALPMSEISRIFNRIRSERLIFIADACYSGASGGRTINLAGIRANISEAFLDRIVSGKGKIILTASGGNEVSSEDDKLKHGVFTYFLLEGLRGKADMDKDGIITVDEAYRYVSLEVPRATGQEQHPMKKGIVEGQLILGVTD